jgi:hypothetical protein
MKCIFSRSAAKAALDKEAILIARIDEVTLFLKI